MDNIKVFSDIRNYRKSMIKSLALVCIPTFSAFFIFLGGDNGIAATFYIVLVFLVMMIILGLVIKKWSANSASFVFEDGRLYRITRFPSEPGRNANAARAAGNILGNEQAGGIAAGIILLSSRGEREAEQIQLATDADYRRYLLNENETIQICRVLKMKKYRSGYKIKCGWFSRTGRERKTSFYIFPGYNDYEQLVACLESLK